MSHPKGNGGLLWAKLQSIDELDTTQRHFMLLTAYGESGGKFNPRAHNDSASEREASRKAYDKNPSLASKLDACAPRAKWIDGSVGLFQRLLPYYGDDTIDIFGKCLPPETAFDMDYAIASALKNARVLQQRPSFADKPTVGTLRLGWWGPGKMDEPQDKAHLAKYRKHAAALASYGVPSDLVDRKLSMFPPISAVRGIFERLRNAPTPAAVELVGPYTPGELAGVAGGPDASRLVTTDAGWQTIRWWRYGDHWLRIDERTNASGGLRWVVVVGAHVLAYEITQTNEPLTAAKLAAAWVDKLKG